MTSKKISDLKKGAKDAVEYELDALSTSMGFDEDGTSNSRGQFSEERFGVCYNCAELRAAKSRYGSITAFYKVFKRMLRGRDPVEHCTEWDRVGWMSIWDAQKIGWIIDVPKNDIGFIKK